MQNVRMKKTRRKKPLINFTDQALRRAREVSRMLPREESLSYLTGIAAIVGTELKEGKTIVKILDEDGSLNGAWALIFSLHLRGAYLEGGEKALLLRLPFWFQLDFEFFMAETWIRKLFGQWLRQGEEVKIKKALFGTPKRGLRSYNLTIKNFQRDKKIAAAVGVLLDKGCGYNKAMKTVASNLKEYGIKDHLSPPAVRSIYKKVKSGYDPLIRLLSAH